MLVQQKRSSLQKKRRRLANKLRDAALMATLTLQRLILLAMLLVSGSSIVAARDGEAHKALNREQGALSSYVSWRARDVGSHGFRIDRCPHGLPSTNHPGFFFPRLRGAVDVDAALRPPPPAEGDGDGDGAGGGGIAGEPASCIKALKSLCGQCGISRSCWEACIMKNISALERAGCTKPQHVWQTRSTTALR